MSRGGLASRGGALTERLRTAWRLRALAASAIIPPLLEVMSFARIERLLSLAARLPAAAPLDDAAAARFVDSALSRLPPPWAKTCLRRSTVLYFLLRSARRPVELCIGVRRNERGALGAHAWLFRDGQPYLEGGAPERIGDYSIIARFPSARQS